MLVMAWDCCPSDGSKFNAKPGSYSVQINNHGLKLLTIPLDYCFSKHSHEEWFLVPDLHTLHPHNVTVRCELQNLKYLVQRKFQAIVSMPHPARMLTIFAA